MYSHTHTKKKNPNQTKQNKKTWTLSGNRTKPEWVEKVLSTDGKNNRLMLNPYAAFLPRPLGTEPMRPVHMEVSNSR